MVYVWVKHLGDESDSGWFVGICFGEGEGEPEGTVLEWSIGCDGVSSTLQSSLAE